MPSRSSLDPSGSKFQQIAQLGNKATGVCQAICPPAKIAAKLSGATTATPFSVMADEFKRALTYEKII